MERQSMILPHSIEAEKGAIGAALQDPSCVSRLVPEWFHDLRLEYLAKAMLEMDAAGQPIDLITVGQRCKTAIDGVLPLLSDCQDHCPSAANFTYFQEINSENYRKRSAITAAREFLQQAPDANGEFDSLLSTLEEKLQPEVLRQFPVSDGRDCAKVLIKHLEDRWEAKGNASGLTTGLRKLDEMTDGLQYGEQTIIAARPSIGKTAIAINIVNWACVKCKVPTLVVSLEMSRAALLRRLLSCACEISMGELRKGDFTDGDFRKFTGFSNVLSASPLFIVDGVCGMDANQMASVIRRYTAQHGVKFVVIDYLQKVKAIRKQEKRTYEVAEVSGAIRGLAVTTKAAFLTLAQLNRESEKEKGRLPRLADLADSGQIERDADTVCLLHRSREPEKAHEATLMVAKQRDGETGPVPLHFEGQYCRFTTKDTE